MENNTNPNENSLENNVENQANLNTEEDCCCNDKKKLNYSLIFNVVLLIAVLILYYLHFNTSGKSFSADSMSKSVSPAEYAIAYVNSDSLMSQYFLFDEYRKKLETKKDVMENEMSQKVKSFEKEVNDFQQKVQSYSVTSDQAQRMEADLMRKQEQLMQLRDNMSNELVEMEFVHQSALFDSIINALTIYNEAHDFDYILGYSKGSGILYANEKFDITADIIKILNKNPKK